MKKIYYIISFIILWQITLSAEVNQIIYLSPGLSISIDIKGNILFSPKISFGLYKNMQFINITLGHVSSSSESSSYYYIEPQIGAVSKPLEYRKIQIFYGLGLGIAFLDSNKNDNIAFRGSLFSGFGLFLNASFLIGRELNTDLGIQAVLPIPLNKDGYGPIN